MTQESYPRIMKVNASIDQTHLVLLQVLETLGWENIDLNEIGLTADFAATDKMNRVLRFNAVATWVACYECTELFLTVCTFQVGADNDACEQKLEEIVRRFSEQLGLTDMVKRFSSS